MILLTLFALQGCGSFRKSDSARLLDPRQELGMENRAKRGHFSSSGGTDIAEFLTTYSVSARIERIITGARS